MRRDPVDLRQALLRTAGQQGGYFSAAQAIEAGYSHQAQKYHADKGSWERVARGVYRLVDWPLPEHPDLIRWHLWSGGRAVASHATALAVHGLGDVMPARVTVTVPAGFRGRAEGIAVHRSDLAPEDVEQREGFAVTTPARSLVDAAEALELDQLDRAVEDALEAGLVTAPELNARAAAAGGTAASAIKRVLGE